MREVSEEKQSDSPLQALLEGAWFILRLDKILSDLERPSNHDDVQAAAAGDN